MADGVTQEDQVPLMLMVGRIDGKLDLLINNHASLDERLSRLEAWKNRALGAVAGISALSGAGIQGIIHMVWN